MEKIKHMILFELKHIPDLALAKYQSDSVGGVDGIFAFHKEFLKQWNRKGVLSKVSLHFFYQYYPEKEFGNRLDIFVGVRGKQEDLNNVQQIMQASSLLGLYPNEIVDLSLKQGELFDEKYNKLCAITKKELFVRTSVSNNRDVEEKYYSIAKMEPSEDGRLFAMFSMMEKLNLPVLYRVDLYPVDVSDRIRDDFNFTLSSMEEKKQRTNSLFSSYGVNEKRLLDKYEDIIEKIENEPHFICNCLVFGKIGSVEDDNLQLLADTIATECIEAGNYSLKTFHFEGLVNAQALLDGEKRLRSNDGKYCLDVNPSIGKFIYHKEAENISLKYLPVLWTLDEVLPFCRLPVVYEGEEIQKPKETKTNMDSNEEGICIGQDSYGRKVCLPYANLMKHVFIAGASGSGKTYALLEILSQIAKKENEKKTNSNMSEINERVNFLVFEPAKKEYRALLGTEEGKNIILVSPHLRSLFPIQINPFEFPKGIMLSQHIGILMKVFGSSFELVKTAYEVLDSAIEHAYVAKGWRIDDCNDGTKSYPTMEEVYERIDSEVEKFGYSSDTKSEIKAFTHLRLGGLMKRDAGEIFNVNRSSWMPEEWLEKSVIIELEALSEQDRNFFVLLVCALIYETLLATAGKRGDEKGRKLKHVILIDEAHNIIAPESYQSTANDAPDPKISASAFIAKMLAEVRALGEGIIIADQLPSAMAPEVIKNTVSKFALKMVSEEDREIMGNAMLANSQQVERMLSFKHGNTLYFGDNMQKPIEFCFHKWEGSIKTLLDEDLCRKVYSEECGIELRLIWLRYLANMWEKMEWIVYQYCHLTDEEKEQYKTIVEHEIEHYKDKLTVIRSYWKLELYNCPDVNISEMIEKTIESIENFKLEEKSDEVKKRWNGNKRIGRT